MREMKKEWFIYQLYENWKTINIVGDLSVNEKVALKRVLEK
jgi:hypothetical protein